MKKLIFIDNDSIKMATDEVDHVKNILDDAGLSSEYIDTMQIIPDFTRVDKDKAIKMFFDCNNAICTFSMYTDNHYGSLYQMTSMLRLASSNRITGMVYVDGSGYISDRLETAFLNDHKNSYHFMMAIETNYILTLNKERDLCRLRMDLKGRDESPFKFEVVNLNALLA